MARTPPPHTLDGPEYEAFLATGSEAPIAIPVEDEYETISINYTSGTTGRPKGVMVHHRGAYLNAIGECMTSGIVSDSRYLWTLPMFHCNGWCCTWGVTRRRRHPRLPAARGPRRDLAADPRRAASPT